MNTSHDSLDYEKQLYQRTKSGYSQTYSLHPPPYQNSILKNFYKQELDNLVLQKNEQKRLERQRENKQRNIYNERINSGIEAQKMKDLSYKNYYHMLANNQPGFVKNFVAPYHEREIQKEKLVVNGIQEERRKSQIWQQTEQLRNDEMKKAYRQHLADQINDKYNRETIEMEGKAKQREQFKKITYTPMELAKLDRERKLSEMQKYKQDLDRTSPAGKERSLTGPYVKNDFNVLRVEDRHNPMVNPLPFNIQNPYILKDIRRRQNLEQQQQFHSNHVL